MLHLHLADISVRVRHSMSGAVLLEEHLRLLVERIKLAQANRKQPQPAVEYRQTEPIFIEVYGNPNLWPTPYAARVLVTLKSPDMHLSGEAELPRLLEDVRAFVEANQL